MKSTKQTDLSAVLDALSVDMDVEYYSPPNHVRQRIIAECAFLNYFTTKLGLHNRNLTSNFLA